MTPTLIVLALLVLGVGIVAWATRRKPTHPAALPLDEDTAWNDPVSPGAAATTPTDNTLGHPFAHAPASPDPELRP